jgi:hypothetical protein
VLIWCLGCFNSFLCVQRVDTGGGFDRVHRRGKLHRHLSPGVNRPHPRYVCVCPSVRWRESERERQRERGGVICVCLCLPTSVFVYISASHTSPSLPAPPLPPPPSPPRARSLSLLLLLLLFLLLLFLVLLLSGPENSDARIEVRRKGSQDITAVVCKRWLEEV